MQKDKVIDNSMTAITTNTATTAANGCLEQSLAQPQLGKPDSALAAASLQQLKAKKNKSNLFLIKSYSFNDKNHNNINNNNNNNNNSRNIDNNSSKPDKGMAKLSTVSAPAAELIVQQPLKKQRQKHKPQRHKAQQQEANLAVASDDTDTQLRSLLRRKAAPTTPGVISEYEQLSQHSSSGLPRPQSLPAKVHFELASAAAPAVSTMATSKRSSSNMKRESFIRQSLQSIRRSFGSNKQQPSKPGRANAAVLQSPAKDAAMSSSSTSSTSSASSNSSSSSAPITMLAQAVGHNRRLDEQLPIPVLVLLNDDEVVITETNGDQLCNGVQLRQQAAVRSANSVGSTLANGTIGIDAHARTSMAPLQQLSGARTAATTAIATTTTTTTTAAAALNEQQQKLYLGDTTANNVSVSQPKDRSLRHSYTSSLSPLGVVQGSGGGSVRSLASSSNSSQSSSSGAGVHVGSLNTAKQHEQQSSAVAAISSTSAAAAGSGAIVAATAAATSTTGTVLSEKDKKRKEVSSSRVKKFHRHFSQVSKDEKLINYFSCALVSEILLQGHLYITDQHFAFYSNVFGYVTKVVIPTSSVTKISKEKTAKIIPNAVGVATCDERHVFGSFISRESAYRLMCAVCSQLATSAEISQKQSLENGEEYFIEDDSSCSISGNESPPQLLDSAAAAAAADSGSQAAEQATLRQRHNASSEKNLRHSDLQPRSYAKLQLAVDGSAHTPIAMRSSAPPGVHFEPATPVGASGLRSSSTSGASSGLSGSSSPITVVGVAAELGHASPAHQRPPVLPPAAPSTPARRGLFGSLRTLAHSVRSRLQSPLPQISELQLLYVGIMLAVLLALFSIFLLYRILDIEAKTNLYNTPVDFNWRSGNDDEIFAEALRWQKELQSKNTEEAQFILSKNLEQISKVRRSLETLSMLIHDRNADSQAAAYTQAKRDDSD